MTESTGTNTGTSTGANLATDMDAAAQRVRDLSEQVVAQAKKNGLTWLEGYERVLKNLLDLEEQAARGTGQDWAATLASTHANFVRETSEVFLGVMRDQLKSCPRPQPRPAPGPPGGGARPRSRRLSQPARPHRRSPQAVARADAPSYSKKPRPL